MKLNISDLPHDKIYVKLSDDFVTEYIIDKIKSIRSFSKQIDISYGVFYNWCRLRRFPLSILMKIANMIGIDIFSIHSNILEVRSGRYPSRGGNLSTSIFPKFPIELSNELVRMLIHLMGDGCITINKKGHYNLQYYNQCDFLRKQFKNDARKVFGNLHIHEAVNKNTPYVFLPAPVSIIMYALSDDFNSHTCSIPDFLIKTSDGIKREIISTFSDDEASVDIKQKRIEFASCNEVLLGQIKKLIEGFEINTSITSTKEKYKNGNTYKSLYFYIRGYYNILKYYIIIAFNHPEKQMKLSKLLSSYKRIPKVN